MLCVRGLWVLLCAFVIGLPASLGLSQAGTAVVAQKRQIALVLATDGRTSQATIDFYKSVYKSLATDAKWDVIPLPTIRAALSHSDESSIGGLPGINRKEFRSKLPRRISRKNDAAPQGARTTSGQPVPQLQRLLDNLRAPAIIIVDCGRTAENLIKACGLYYYDRVSARVIASSVKEFAAGANTVSNWADPMLRALNDGLETAQREKDEKIIEELVARNERDDDEEKTKGVIAIYGKGDRSRLSDNFAVSLAGLGLQLGFLTEDVGAVVDFGRLSWSGNNERWSKVERTNYGITAISRFRALDSLLWYFEIAGGKMTTVYKGNSNEELNIDGLYTSVGPGVGAQLFEMFSLNLGVSWSWFFERSSNATNSASNISQVNDRLPQLTLRGMFIF